jgi:hypothetical protein
VAHEKQAGLALILVVCTCLSGCAAVGDITGAVAGVVSGAITANPAVGIGVGIAARAAANEAVARVSLSRQRNEQEAIAAAVADADVGESRPWTVDQRVTGDAHGEVRVIRLIETPLAMCKEVLFSVVAGDGAAPAWFSTTACEAAGRWRWAAAEPAVERWGNLQ